MDKKRLSQIMNRSRVYSPKISLSRLLQSKSMGEYLNVCSNRIADTGFIDGEHVEIDFIHFPDILLDSRGLMRCSDILEGYIDEDSIYSAFEYIRCEEKIAECINDQLEMLRSADMKTLINNAFFARKVLKSEIMTFSDSDIKEIARLCRAELFGRNYLNRLRVKVMELGVDLYVKIRYRNLFAMMKQCVDENR